MEADRQRKDVAQDTARALLYANKSLSACMERSAAWHRAAETIDAKVKGAGTVREWAPLLNNPLVAGDMRVVSVADSLSLREEGAQGVDRNGRHGLSHCIAARLPVLMAGSSHVLSIRRALPEGGYVRLSTAQVTVRETHPGHYELKVLEHRGHDNDAPPEGCHEAIDLLIELLMLGKVIPNPGALLVRAPHIKSGYVQEDCGYDWRDPDALATAILAWEPILPRWARGHDPEAFAAACIAHGALPVDWLKAKAWN